MNDIIKLIPFHLLKKSLTTPEDLRKIANSLGFSIDYIGFGYNFSEIKDICKLCILNIGNDLIGGTHWVAVNNKTKEYFDPLGAPPPDYIPKDYKHNNHNGIQDMKWGHCGQYCVLWLYYSNKGKSNDFFKLFSNSIIGGAFTTDGLYKPLSRRKTRFPMFGRPYNYVVPEKIPEIKKIDVKPRFTPEQLAYQEEKIKEARKGIDYSIPTLKPSEYPSDIKLPDIKPRAVLNEQKTKLIYIPKYNR